LEAIVRFILRVCAFGFFILYSLPMVIDIITLILLALAIKNGYSRGFILALFSFLAVFIGLAAAIKCSVMMAGWLHTNTNISDRWLPFLSFALVMIIVIILVRLIARLLQASVELVMLGWLNRLAGIALYMVLYMIVYSIVLFYATKMGIIKESAMQSSVTYSIIEPMGPRAVDVIGSIIPIFKNMFQELENFFNKVPQNVA
jgi:membrane protein required for colicin V production